MIGYAPIDFEEDFEIPQIPKKREIVSNDFVNKNKKVQTKAQPVVEDETECNYLVMFFIVGVIALAAMDSIKK